MTIDLGLETAISTSLRSLVISAIVHEENTFKNKAPVDCEFFFELSLIGKSVMCLCRK